MKVDTIKGSSYVMTCTKACTVSAIFNSGETSMLILEAGEKGQYGFAAPTDAVEVSDEDALITQVFKTAVPRLPGQNGIRQGENAELKNLTAESGTFAGAVNANGGINIPLTVGAATDTSAVNRLYAAGLSAVTDAFSVRCYPLLADCSSSNGTVFKTDKEPNSLYFNVPPNSAFTVKCGLVTNARPMHNYSSIRGWVAPLRLPSVSAKFTARFGQMKTVARMGRDRDAFTLAPDQAAGGYRIGEIIDITFDHVRGRGRGGIPHSCPGDLLFQCRAEMEDEDDAGPRAGDVFQ